MTARHVILIILLLTSLVKASATDLGRIIPDSSPRYDGYQDIDSIKHRLSSTPLDYIEGLWLLNGSQTTVAIERNRDRAIGSPGLVLYTITVVDSPRRSLRPGTVLGYIQPGSGKEYYEARLYTRSVRCLLQRHRPFRLKHDGEDNMTLEPKQSRWNLALRRTFNFLTRVSLYSRTSDQPEAEGLVRLYPTTSGKSTPFSPVYL